MLSALALIAAPVATATASAAPSVPRGGDPLALLAVQQAELTASDAAANDEFGMSVALSGDTALVGAPYRTVGGQTNAGVAYVFVRSGTSWSQQAELSDPDPAANDWFGDSVALDGGTALVGAAYKTVSGQTSVGATYVFVRSGTSWSQQAELTASDAAANDEFGISVALSGDTALVGAFNKTVAGQSAAGAAYVFVRSGTTWSQQAELTASDAAANDQFGMSVALAGDTAVIGAWQKTVGTVSVAGAAYVFVRSGTTWSRQAELSDPDAASNDGFGYSVAVSGDTALVGAPGKIVSSQANAGVAYVFVRSGTTWSPQAEFSDPSAAGYDYFGDSVALSGDTALVGAPGKTVSSQATAGVAYVFTRSGTSWSPEAEFSDPSAVAGDYLGISVALSGDTALVGAFNKTVGGQSDAGAAYVEVLPSSDDTLSNLTVSAGALSPSFTAAHLDYTDNVANSVSTITVTPTLNDAGSSYVLKVGSNTVTDPIPLNLGANVIDVVVTAQNLASKTYVVTVTRAAPLSSDDTLSNLTVSAGTLSPSFTAAHLSYTDSVANSVSTITVTPTVNESHAGYVLKVGSDTVTNPIPLNVGANVIDVQVTAQDGSSQTYSVTVTRAAPLSSDDTLSNLTVSAGTLSPSFTAAHLDYTDNVAHSVSTITVTPTVNESHAGYVLKVGSTTVTDPITLNVGDNVIDVQVTAQDGSNQTYSVTVTRAALVTSKLTLKLSGLTGGVLKLGKSLAAKGTVTPTSLAGGTVTLTVQRKQGSTWLTLTSLTPTIGATGAYSGKYKPATKGSYRIQATVAKTATSTAAATKWLTFKVK